MKTQKITARPGEDGVPMSVDVNLPETVDEAVKTYGEAAVYSRFLSALVIDMQAAMRTRMKAGKTEKDISTELASWKPGVRVAGATPIEKAKGLLSKLSPEERKELLKAIGKAA